MEKSGGKDLPDFLFLAAFNKSSLRLDRYFSGSKNSWRKVSVKCQSINAIILFFLEK